MVVLARADTWSRHRFDRRARPVLLVARRRTGPGTSRTTGRWSRRHPAAPLSAVQRTFGRAINASGRVFPKYPLGFHGSAETVPADGRFRPNCGSAVPPSLLISRRPNGFRKNVERRMYGERQRKRLSRTAVREAKLIVTSSVIEVDRRNLDCCRVVVASILYSSEFVAV